MARLTNIRLRRSATSGNIPTTSQLDLGELALNTYDGKLFLKKEVSGVQTIVEVGGGGGSQQSGIWSEYVYTATSNQTTFSGSDDNSQTLTYVVGYLQVFLNGILLDNGTDYTANNSSSVVLVNGANSGDLLQISTFVKVLGTADIAVDTFSGTGSQTNFTLSANPDVEENIQVYIDGVYQEQSTYSVSTNTLTFSTAPASGTTIEVSIGTRNVTLANLEDLTASGFFIGDLNGAVVQDVYNNTATQLNKGDAVYLTGGNNGDNPHVDLCDNTDSAKMPALGVVRENIAAGSVGQVVTSGVLNDSSHGYTLGADLYINSTGQLTTTIPTGEGELLQKIGKVVSSNHIIIQGAFRTNAVPNLNDGNIFIGDSNNQAVTGNLNTLVNTHLASGNTGNVVIGGDLTVQGNTTTLNTATLDVEDLNITVGSGATSSSTADGSGLTFGDYTGKATFTWDDSESALVSNKALKALSIRSDANISIEGSNNELRFYEGSNYVGFEAGALSADQIWVLPTADGSAGHALKTDGSGNLSWGLAGGNAFETIAVSGQSDVVADSISDTLTFAGGSGITLTTDASTDTITITNTSLGANAFGNVAVSGQTTVAADSTGDTLTLVGQNGVTITTDASSDTVTIDGHTSYAPFNTDLFTANGTDTNFVLSSTPSSEDNLIVFVEGVYQNKNSFSLSGSTLTISPAVPNTQEIVVHQIGDVVSGVGLLRNNFTGDGSTTDFTLSQDPLHEDNLFIYFDGVYQNKSEFSVSGTTLSFTTAPDSGDSIEVIVPKMTEIQQPSTNTIDDEAQFNTGNIIPQVVTSTSVASTSATTIASHSATTYRTIKYLVQCTQGTDYHSTEINLIHDGTTVYITEYGTLFDNAALGTFDATISSGNILLQITAGSSSNMDVKVISSAIPL